MEQEVESIVIDLDAIIERIQWSPGISLESKTHSVALLKDAIHFLVVGDLKKP